MLKQRLTAQAGLCLIGCLQLIAFTSVIFQLPFLYGRHGVQPVSNSLDELQQQQVMLAGSFGLLPRALLWLHGAMGITAEAMLTMVVVAGWLVSLAAACGALHFVTFAATWVLYLSFTSLGGSFVDYGDKVLLEVSFAAMWLAMVHSNNRAAQQRQQQQRDAIGDELPHLPDLQKQSEPSQRLSTAVLLLFKWLLFRLLLVTSTFAATLACGREPALGSCFKSLVAQGQPHLFTRWFQMLWPPLAAPAAAVMLLELPAAFLVLLYAPALQHATALSLLSLQLLRLVFGPASLANLAAAVLCFLLLDDARWVPVLLKLGKAARLIRPPASDGQEGQQAEGQPMGQISRTSSVTSMFDGQDFGEAAASSQQAELGESILDNYNWVPWLVLAAFFLAAAFLFGYDSSAGLVLRPSPRQLLSVLQVAVPVAMLVWLAAAAPACWSAIRVSWTSSKAGAVAARAAAAEAAEAAKAAATKVAAVAAAPAPATPPAAAAAAAGTPVQAAGAAGLEEPQTAAPEPQANGKPLYNDAVELPGRYLHFLGLQPPLPPAAAVALLHGEGHLANGVHAPGEAVANGEVSPGHAPPAAAPEAAAGGTGSSRAGTKTGAGRGRGGGRGAGRGRASKAAAASAAAAAEAPPGALHPGAGAAFAGLQQPAEGEQVAAAVPEANGNGTPVANSKAAAAAVATPAAAGASDAKAAALEAAQHSAARAAAQARSAKRAVWGAWVPAVSAVLATVVLLATFLAGAPLLLTAVGYDQAELRQFVPGPLLSFSQWGHSYGIATGSSSVRSAFLAAQAAAASGSGSIMQFEAYTLDDASVGWQRVPLQYSIGAAGLQRSSSMWERLCAARGWYQTRLQARMAAAAAPGPQGSGSSDAEPWLVLLADKIVEGSPHLVGMLDGPSKPHEYVTISRTPYTAAAGGWYRHQADTTAVPPQHRGSEYLHTYRQEFSALPGHDGVLVVLVERLARSVRGPVALTALLLVVALRHLLLPGGVVRECQQAMASLQATA